MTQLGQAVAPADGHRSFDVPKSEIGKWFDPGELRRCPVCGQQKLLPLPLEPGPVKFCLKCGPLAPASRRD